MRQRRSLKEWGWCLRGIWFLLLGRGVMYQIRVEYSSDINMLSIGVNHALENAPSAVMYGNRIHVSDGTLVSMPKYHASR